MAGGLLTVVNPRRHGKRRNKRARSHRRRKNPHRRHALMHYNPPRRHRRRNARRAYSRRRHHNPRFGAGMLTPLIHGLTFSAGAVGVNLATNGINYMIGGGAKGGGTPLTGLGKIGLKAGIGLGGFFLLNMLQPTKPFAKTFAVGAGIAVGLDLYETYVKAKLPTYLQGEEIQGYGTEQISGYGTQQISGFSNTSRMYAQDIV